MCSALRVLLFTLVFSLSSANTWAAGPSYEIEVAGLACPFCAYGIEKQLDTIEGVEGVATDIRSGIVTVTMRDGSTLDEKTARRAVKAAGFTLSGFKPTGTDE
ncbi:MAG: hypothetical protein COA65_03835 [Rhodospirillaceae bacterium]|nr:MAG: hypothetical protein COA65_03835 [Rhodospirillaceae bacterium]